MVSRSGTVDAAGTPPPAFPTRPYRAAGCRPAVIVPHEVFAVKSELKPEPLPGARFAAEPSLRTEAGGPEFRAGAHLR
jgi:dienelactone hydrolase